MAQSTTRCEQEFGNNRYVKVCEWKGELRVDIREWNEGKPTKKGIVCLYPGGRIWWRTSTKSTSPRRRVGSSVNISVGTFTAS
ncbi:MAG: transcriptional coactivator p15/PC4 family protein [Sedimenticola sp.]